MLYEVITEVDPGELAPRHGEVPRAARADGEEHGVVLGAQGGPGGVGAHPGAGAEGDALGLEHGEAPVEDPPLQLVVGDPVAEETPVITSYSIHYTKLYDSFVFRILFSILLPGDSIFDILG